MRKKLTSIATSIALVLILIPAPQAQAVNSEIFYTIRYTCICSPSCPTGQVVGEWTRPCQGEMYGWGVQPYQYTSCHSTEVTYGDLCED